MNVMINYSCTCTYPFSDGIADGWIRILAWTFGKVSGSTNALSSHKGLKKGEEGDASNEHDGGGSFDQSVDFQVSADWLLLVRSKYRRIEMKKSEYDCCRRERRGGTRGASIDAADSKRFHFGSFAEDPTEDSSGEPKKKILRPKDIFSLAVTMRSRRDSTSRDIFWLDAALNLLNLSFRNKQHCCCCCCCCCCTIGRFDSFILLLSSRFILRMSRQLVLGRGRRTGLSTRPFLLATAL